MTFQGGALGAFHCIMRSMSDVVLPKPMPQNGNGNPIPLEEKQAKEAAKLQSGDQRVQKALIRRGQLVTLISKGLTIEAACKEMGLSRQTYYQYRSDFPLFRAQVDMAKAQWYTEQQGKTTEEVSWKGFTQFRKKFFNFDTYYHQAMISQAIEETGEMEVVLVLVPPEHGKTTLMEDKICEILATDPDHRICYISEARGHARKVGSRVRRRMTDTNEFGLYTARYGPFYEKGQEKNGKPWTADFFTVFKAGHDERDYSFEARGYQSHIQGSRVDTLFIDDVQSLKSLGRTDDLLQKFQQEWITRVGKAGRTIIVGTRVGVGDIYDKLMERELVTRLIELPALDEDGESLCPEMWPTDALNKRRKQVGEDIWHRTYQQNPIAAGAVTFDTATLTAAKDVSLIIGRNPGVATVMSLDPGLGGGNVLTVCQYTPEKMWLVDQVADYGFGRTEQILARVREFANMYRPQDFVIEMMAFQQALGKDDRMLQMADQYGFRIYPHVTQDNKFDSTFGVASMASSMRCGEMTIPWGNEDAQERFEPLIRELMQWRPNVRGVKLVQDRVMSLWFAYLFWYKQREYLQSETIKIKLRSMPWQPSKVRIFN